MWIAESEIEQHPGVSKVPLKERPKIQAKSCRWGAPAYPRSALRREFLHAGYRTRTPEQLFLFLPASLFLEYSHALLFPRQFASTDSEQYFNQKRMYGRSEIHCQKKEKIKKPGLFKVINFASWVQWLIAGGQE